MIVGQLHSVHNYDNIDNNNYDHNDAIISLHCLNLKLKD